MGPPPNPTNLQARFAAGPHMTQPGASGLGKSVSHFEISGPSIQFLITLLFP